MANFLTISHVSKVYTHKKGIIKALDDVSLTIEKGEIFSLLGVNGAGKTTLSSLLATLHPVSAGEILYNGQSIYAHLEEYRMHVGYCPQYPNLDVHVSVEDNLIFAGRYFLQTKEQATKRAHELMQQLHLTRYAQAPVHALSGGYKQRLSIARALMHHPTIVILDEPTVGLDPDIRRQLWDIIIDLKKMGITIILTTHYLDEAEMLSDRVCLMHKGKVKQIDTVENLKTHYGHDTLEKAFLAFTQEASEYE